MSITVVKSEWHQLERRFGIEIDEDFLSEIYTDYDEEQISELMQQIQDGEVDINDVMTDAYNEGVDIDWDWLDEDDLWTDRKGGYDVTYEVLE